MHGRRLAIFVLAVAASAIWAGAQQPPQPEGPLPHPSSVSVKQVQIQVWIGETGEEALRDLGANINYTRFVRGVEQSGSVERVTTQVFDPLNPLYSVTLPAPDASPAPDNLRPDADPARDGVQTQSGAGLTASIIDTGRGTVDAVYRAIEQRSDVDLVSRPEILVRDGQQAEIHAGGQVPFQNIKYTNKGEPQLNVQWKNIGVSLRLRPDILSDDLVQLNIGKLDVSDIARIDNIRGVDLPVFSTRSQTGLVVVPNGQTLVIGGLSSSTVRRSERRVPIVGKVPILGIPFRAHKAESLKTNLLIFVSPTIIDLRDMEPEAVRALDFWRQPEWRDTERIEQEIETLEEEL